MAHLKKRGCYNIARVKLNKKVIERAKELANNGNYDYVIAGAIGIGRRTFYTWLKRGEEDYERGVSSLYRQFYEAMEESRSFAETEAVKGILEAGKKQWQALAWFLERRYPERWGLKKRSDDDEDQKTKAKELADAIRKAADAQLQASESNS